MLPYIASLLEPFFGPFRLLGYRSVLILIGAYAGFFFSLVLLPRFFKFLPSDQGREYAVENNIAKGKPTGSGVVFISIFIVIALITVPFSADRLLSLGLLGIVMIFGFLDDRSQKPWGEYSKGLIDLILALVAAAVLCGFEPFPIWLPFTKAVPEVPPLVFIPCAALLIWISINSTNCSDGVDGLSSTLVLFSLISLGLILYFIVGHTEVAAYLLIPHTPDGADWAILNFTMTGCLAAYLWYNAYPSTVLMGDAGSRALGFLIGISVIKTGNPFLYFVIATVLLVNGGTGLVKVALLRFLKIRIFHNTRFPLHDHLRENRKWSNTQVLVKFAIIQILLTVGLLGIMVKIR